MGFIGFNWNITMSQVKQKLAHVVFLYVVVEVRCDVWNMDLKMSIYLVTEVVWFSFIDDNEDEDAVVNRISWVKLIPVNSSSAATFIIN